MDETPLRMNDVRMDSAAVGDDSREIADARSQDRLELYLTPNGRLRYTLSRLKRYFPLGERGHSRRSLHPSVRLYAPPLELLTRTGRVEPVTELRSAGSDELLLGHGDRGCSLKLGIKVREVPPGQYVAMLLVSDDAGSESLARETRFQAGCPGVEWVLPPAELWLVAGSRFRLTLDRIDDGRRSQVYESLPVRVGNEPPAVRQRQILGAAGTRILDLIFAASAMLTLSIPFALAVLYLRRQVVTRYPEVAAARRAAAKGRFLRFAAPALYCDESRWTWQNGRLAEGTIYKIETLTPDKRPILGRMSVLMRGWGVDEWPQLLAIFNGGWALFGPRAVPNRDGLLAPDGATVQNSRDLEARYRVGGAARKPGALSLRLALTPRGATELPPWRTMLLYDRYDCTHWSIRHALRVVARLGLSFLWGEALHEHHGPIETRVPRMESLPGNRGGGES